MVTKRMISYPKAAILSRVVVVGEGTCALSVVEHLSMAGDCYLPNVVLVTPNPLADPSYCQSLGLGHSMLSSDFDAPAHDELVALGIGNMSSIHVGHITKIDRDGMEIALDSGLTIPYDKLILAPIAQDATYKQLHKLGTRPQRSLESIGIFFLGHEVTGINASQWLMHHHEHVRPVPQRENMSCIC